MSSPGITSKAILEFNKECIQYGMAQVKTRFPHGATNSMNNIASFAKTEGSKQLFTTQIILCNKFSMQNQGSLKDFEQNPELLAGNCDLFARYGIQMIKQKFPEAQVEFVALQNHVLVLAGRPLESNPDKLSTWGDTAYLGDFWSEEDYLAQDFFSHRESKDTKLMPFFKSDNTPEEDGKAYLAGTPRVHLKNSLAIAILCGLSYKNQLSQYHQHIVKKYKDKDFSTCLRRACFEGDDFDVDFLLHYCNTSVNSFAENQRVTALDYAINKGHVKCVKLLKEKKGKQYSELTSDERVTMKVSKTGTNSKKETNVKTDKENTNKQTMTDKSGAQKIESVSPPNSAPPTATLNYT